MFQDDMNGKDESGVYEIKYGDHMFFVPKRMDDGVEAIMAIERICCRGFSFKRKRKKLIGFMRDIWAFAIDEDRREIAGRIEREFAGWELEKLKLQAAFVVDCFFLLPAKVQPARQNCRKHHAIPPPAKKIRQKFALAEKSGILYM